MAGNYSPQEGMSVHDALNNLRELARKENGAVMNFNGVLVELDEHATDVDLAVVEVRFQHTGRLGYYSKEDADHFEGLEGAAGVLELPHEDEVKLQAWDRSIAAITQSFTVGFQAVRPDLIICFKVPGEPKTAALAAAVEGVDKSKVVTCTLDRKELMIEIEHLEAMLDVVLVTPQERAKGLRPHLGWHVAESFVVPGVRYHKDGSGTPDDADVNELGTVDVSCADRLACIMITNLVSAWVRGALETAAEDAMYKEMLEADRLASEAEERGTED